jgi:spore coat polysaccharide biosynthesis protein SpsF
MGSSRLPGKVLARIGTRTILAHCIHRLRQSGLPVIVATSAQPADDAVLHEAGECGVDTFRGSETDVLARYLGAAAAFSLSEVVRATADNPFVDPDGPQRVLRFRQRVAADHVVECGLPVGAAVEAVSVDALTRAAAIVTDPYDREHVTSLVRRDTRFRALRAVAPGYLRRPGLRLTVDTETDLDFARDVYSRLESGVDSPLSVVIKTADSLLVRDVARARVRQGA